MTDYVTELREAVEINTSALLAISHQASAIRPAPGKWSPREIIGHLIDSASNNHQRFVRSQFQDNLIFAGYDQEAWVDLQQYQQESWQNLIDLWRSYNLHLAQVMEAIPEETRQRKHRRHNLYELAWRPVPEDEPATLDYFMQDYVGHLKNHLRQILET